MIHEESRYTLRTIRTQEELSEITDAWVTLLNQREGEHNLAHDPKFIALELKKNPNLPLHILLIYCDDELVCIAPGKLQNPRLKVVFSVFSLKTFRTKILKLANSRPIFRKNADIERCIKLLLQTWGNDKEFDLVLLEDLELKSPLATFFERNGGDHSGISLIKTSPNQENIWRHFTEESYDAWLLSLGQSTRRLTKRRVKKIHQEFPDKVDLCCITSENDVSGYLDAVNKIFPKTWQAKTFGLKTKNTSEDKQFYSAIARNGWMKSFVLFIEKKPVAFLTATQYNAVFEAIEMGYDPEYSHFGIGSVLNYMILQHLYAEDTPEIISFGFGDNIYKSLICNSSSPATGAYIAIGLKEKFTLNVQSLLGRMEYLLRKLVIQAKLDSFLRKLLKHK